MGAIQQAAQTIGVSPCDEREFAADIYDACEEQEQGLVHVCIPFYYDFAVTYREY